MGTFGPRPLDSVEIAKSWRTDQVQEAPWEVEQDRPRSYRPLSPPSRLGLVMEVLLLVIAVGWVTAFLLGLIRR